MAETELEFIMRRIINEIILRVVCFFLNFVFTKLGFLGSKLEIATQNHVGSIKFKYLI